MTKHIPTKRKLRMLFKKHKIERILDLLDAGAKLDSVLQIEGVSRASFFRWRKQYLSRADGYNLMPHWTTPLTLRKPSVLTSSFIALVRDIRSQFPFYGPVKIHHILFSQGIHVSVSSVARAIHKLVLLNHITPVPILKASRIRKQLRNFSASHAKRLPKGYKAMFQIDHTIVPLQDGSSIRQFNAIEVHSRLCFAKAYYNATADNAKDFLLNLIDHVKLPIKDIQVDGGSEFRASFDKACKDHHIPLFILPPRSPSINGKVERLNQTWKDEFYTLHYHDLFASDLNDLNHKIERWQFYYNHQRPHRALLDSHNHLLTPAQALIYAKR